MLPAHSPLRGASLDGTPVRSLRGAAELAVQVRGRGRHCLDLEFNVGLRTEPARRQDLVAGKHSLWYGPMPLGTNVLLDRVGDLLAPTTLAAATYRLAEGACGSELEIALPVGDARAGPRAAATVRALSAGRAGFPWRHALTYLF